jgi:redox-sensitive bicupin YhaK (pirin superfamily)
VHVAEGKVRVNGQELTGGDAAAVSDAGPIELAGEGNAQVLLFDLN